jgi:hypothetical protein
MNDTLPLSKLARTTNATPATAWRRPVAAAAVLYVGMGCAALAAWLLLTQRATPVDFALPCALPLLLVSWLLWRREAEDRQFVVQLLAAMGFGPLLLGFWAGSQPAAAAAAAWPWMLPAALLHLAVFVAAVVWLGSHATRVAAAAGCAPVDVDTLLRRLQALPGCGVPCTLATVAADRRLVFDLSSVGEGRSHRVTLALDVARRQVRVAERLGAAGARPLSADEASMRRVGDPLLDASRPDAQRISGATWQATMIDPQRLAALPPQLLADGVQLPPAVALGLDAEGVVTLLCAVVTRSGWGWQPGWKA